MSPSEELEGEGEGAVGTSTLTRRVVRMIEGAGIEGSSGYPIDRLIACLLS